MHQVAVGFFTQSVKFVYSTGDLRAHIVYILPEVFSDKLISENFMTIPHSVYPTSATECQQNRPKRPPNQPGKLETMQIRNGNQYLTIKKMELLYRYVTRDFSPLNVTLVINQMTPVPNDSLWSSQ